MAADNHVGNVGRKAISDYFDNCPLVHIQRRNYNVDIFYALRMGLNEIRRLCELVRQCTRDLDVFPLHSSLPASDQSLALSSSGPKRRCIVATNIAETSLTVDNVVYSKEEYDSMEPSTEPAIRCSPPHSVILKLVTSGYRRVFDFDWIDSPHPESIVRAAQDLRDWYANNGHPTPLLSISMLTHQV